MVVYYKETVKGRELLVSQLFRFVSALKFVVVMFVLLLHC